MKKNTETLLQLFNGIKYMRLKRGDNVQKVKNLKMVFTNERILLYAKETSFEDILRTLKDENNLLFKKAINLSDLEEARFPSLEKIKSKLKKNYAVRFEIKPKLIMTMGLEEGTFFSLRDYLKDSLKLNPKGEVNHEYCQESKQRILLLAKRPELSNLYEQLVINSKCISHDEFFVQFEGNEEMKRLALANQKLSINEKFNNMNQVDVDLGEEIIYMKQEDKLMLLENFPDLKDDFQKRFLSKFGDRKEKEAKFWDTFWERQKANQTLLYGGQSKNKEHRVKMPNFSDQLEQNYHVEQEQINQDLENMDFLEKDGELYEEWNLDLTKKSQVKSNSILEYLNNHSRVIQTKE